MESINIKSRGVDGGKIFCFLSLVVAAVDDSFVRVRII